MAMFKKIGMLLVCGVYFFISSVYAQSVPSVAGTKNSIESIVALQEGNNVTVKITLTHPINRAPMGFSVSNPARVVLDFPSVGNMLGSEAKTMNVGDVISTQVVEAAERSRVILNLKRTLNYSTSVAGNVINLTLGEGSNGAKTNNVDNAPKVSLPTKSMIRDIDFRKGSGAEGRVLIDLSKNDVVVDVRQQGQKVIVDFMGVELPEILRRRMDVMDFGTPIQTVSVLRQGPNVRMIIEPSGIWDYSSYQSGTQMVVEVRPIKEDPNKLGQGTRGYRGDKLSLNFQNVEVRAILQVIADFTGFNVVTSESVSGNLTLRLKDVPWDQALDIVMQAKGLDMRKNGNVLWIAPRDELLTKEKLDLEKMSQISDLEPLKTEIFQLNYQKADSFKSVFALDSKGGQSSILSKRGSASAELRTNKLFVTDTAARLEEVRKLIAATDIPSRQVLIEARIVEATDNFSKDLGAKLSFGVANKIGNTNIEVGGRQTGSVSTSGTVTGLNSTGLKSVNGAAVNLPVVPTAGDPGSLALTIFNANATKFIGLELSALEAERRGKIISSPRVVTADQLPALIEQGEELPCAQYDDKGRVTITYKKAALKLNVTPQITPDGSIILAVNVSKDSRGILVSGCYSVNTKNVQTNVQVENGGTIVLGGIFLEEESDAETKVPLLGDVPLMGRLFRSNNTINNKTELLIFLTPKIVTDRNVIK
jgi:type IV pilus assembly protein PilQ